MSSKNKILIHRYYDEIFNLGNIENLDKYLAHNFVDHNSPPNYPPGLDSAKKIYKMFFNKFPDRHATISDLISEDDYVVVRVNMRILHQDPNTNFERRANVTGIDIYKVVEQKITDHWGNFDELSLIQQLDN